MKDFFRERKQMRIKRIGSILILLGIITNIFGKQEEEKNNMFGKLKISGDSRIETTIGQTTEQDMNGDKFDHTVMSIRFRLELTSQINKYIYFGSRLVSGSDSATSTDEIIGNPLTKNFSTKGFHLDNIYIMYIKKGKSKRLGENLLSEKVQEKTQIFAPIEYKIIGGKFSIKEYLESDFWDRDLSPEGFASSEIYQFGKSNKFKFSKGTWFLRQLGLSKEGTILYDGEAIKKEGTIYYTIENITKKEVRQGPYIKYFQLIHMREFKKVNTKLGYTYYDISKGKYNIAPISKIRLQEFFVSANILGNKLNIKYDYYFSNENAENKGDAININFFVKGVKVSLSRIDLEEKVFNKDLGFSDYGLGKVTNVFEIEYEIYKNSILGVKYENSGDNEGIIIDLEVKF